MNTPTQIKVLLMAVLTPVLAFIVPTLGCAALCAVMVLLDCLTAWRLARRVARSSEAPKNTGKFSSRKFSRSIACLAKIFVALLVAHGVDTAILDDAPMLLGLGALQLMAAAICLWQLLSILENEASCSDNRWAGPLRKWLVDKAARHLRP